MDYKIGFYYHFPHLTYHNKTRLIVVYKDGFFQFKLINHDIQNKYNSRWEHMTCYYSFDIPILYKEDDNGNIQDIIFLMDLQNYSPNTHFDGFSIGEPGRQKHSTSLYFNGQNYFQNNNNWLEISFSMAVIHYYAVRKKVLYLRKEAEPNTLIDTYMQYIKEMKSYLDTIDINVILSDLKVSVEDHLKTKIGDDDIYFIHRIAHVSSPIVENDDYLKKVIGVGRKCIYKDSGYTNRLEFYAEDFKKDHPLGEYSGELLERERQCIIKSYSKEEHMGFLMAKRFIEKERNRGYELPCWELILNEAYEDLFCRFKLKNISNDDREFEKKMYVLTKENSDAKKEISAINNFVKEITYYTPRH